jgi:histidinol-phosphate aminotransferase
MDIRPLLRRSIADVKPPSYPVADPSMLRMDANTNLYGPNPVVERAIADGAWRDANHYPSGFNDELRAVVAGTFGLTPAEIMVGDGSDELLDTIVKTFCNPDDVVAAPVPTFVMYAFYAKVNGSRFVGVPLDPPWRLNPDGLAATGAKATFIASPNNPTANRHPVEAIERVVRASEGIVVVDEAYAEFCGQDFLSRVREFPNLVVTRTFSKSHGLAGLRVGFAAARREIMERLYAAKTPFTVSSVSERIAAAALRDRTYLDATRRMLESERPFLRAGLEALGYRVYPSDANFLLVECGKPAQAVVQRLRDRGILVRGMADFAGLDTCFRVTVGRREHNERLLREAGRA